MAEGCQRRGAKDIQPASYAKGSIRYRKWWDNSDTIPTTMSTDAPMKLVLTSIPPIFLTPACSVIAYMSFGHFKRTLSPNAPSTLGLLHASTTANPKRYWINTSLDAGKDARGTRNKSENCRQPGGESHMFDPRPLPAN